MVSVIQDKNELNSRIFNSATHLFEAGRFMSDVDPKLAQKWMDTAQKLLEVIPENALEKEHLSKEEMGGIMDEIFGGLE